MMKRWAVSFIDWGDNDLTTVIVQADTWIDAVFMHPKTTQDPEWEIDIRDKANDVEAVKQMFFDCDSMIECIEIPDAP